MTHALASCTLRGTVLPFRLRPTVETVNSLEQHSLTALVAYSAHHHGLTEEQVRAWVTASFRVPSLTALPRSAYDAAVRALVDCDPALPLPERSAVVAPLARGQT